MGYHNIQVTPAEMMEMRRQGMSNHDIAKSLDISKETVRKYIGKQGGRMGGLDAFKDAPPKQEKQKVAGYQPKINREEYAITDDYEAEISHKQRKLTITSESGDMLELPFESIPDILCFLAWVARERISDGQRKAD